MIDRITALMAAMFVVVIWGMVATNANYAMGEPLEIDPNPDGTIDVSCVSCTAPGHVFFAPIYGGVAVVNALNAVEHSVVGVFESVFLRDDPGTGHVPDNETVVGTAYVDAATARECAHKAWKSVSVTESGSYKAYPKLVNDTFGNPTGKCWLVVTRP